MIFKILWLCFLLIIPPLVLGNGLLMCLNLKKSAKLGYIYGWIFLLAIFECVVVPVTFLNGTLTVLVWIYSVLVLASGVIIFAKCKTEIGLKCKWKTMKVSIGKINLYSIISICLLMTQLLVAIFGVHMDADDAYYIGTANTSISTDTLFTIAPDTGIPYQIMPIRYAFSAIMIFWAYLSRLTGVHPLIITHSIISVLFILISYVIWWELGKALLGDNNKTWIFFLIVNLLNIFGNTSVYTQSSFLLFRIWQGKAMLPNIILPVLLLSFLEIWEAPQKKRVWLLIFLIVIAGCCCSSMAVPLGAMVVISASIVLMIKFKEWKMLMLGVVSCIPCLVIGVAYIIMR